MRHAPSTMPRKNTAAELETERKRHQVAITKADQEASDLRGQLAAAVSELATAKAKAEAAREEAAKLRGHVEAMQAQNADLMRALADKKAK